MNLKPANDTKVHSIVSSELVLIKIVWIETEDYESEWLGSWGLSYRSLQRESEAF